MTDDAKKVLELINKDGSKTLGSYLRESSGLGPESFKKAKYELRELGLVELGRGRGGSVSLIVGAKIPEEPHKMSQGEKLAIAREVKVNNSRQKLKNEKITNYLATKLSEELGVKEERLNVLYGPGSSKNYVEVWDKNRRNAKVYRIQDEAITEAENV